MAANSLETDKKHEGGEVVLWLCASTHSGRLNPTVNKRPTRLSSRYFFTGPAQIFVTRALKKLKNFEFWREIFQTPEVADLNKRIPDPVLKFWPVLITSFYWVLMILLQNAFSIVDIIKFLGFSKLWQAFRKLLISQRQRSMGKPFTFYWV